MYIVFNFTFNMANLLPDAYEKPVWGHWSHPVTKLASICLIMTMFTTSGPSVYPDVSYDSCPSLVGCNASCQSGLRQTPDGCNVCKCKPRELFVHTFHIHAFFVIGTSSLVDLFHRFFFKGTFTAFASTVYLY